MKINDLVKPGDLILVQGDGNVSKAIRKVTHGQTNHVGVVYDDVKIFETDLSWGKAEFHDLEKYENVRIRIVRLKGLTYMQECAIQKLCEKYDATPYSFVDILTNFLLSPFNDSIRKKIVSVIGTKKYAICSELTARIIYEVTGYEPLSGYESLTPQDILAITKLYSPDWEVVLDRFQPVL